MWSWVQTAMLQVDYVWNVMSHPPKPDFVSRRNGRVHLNRRGRQFRRLLAADVCASAVVMLDTPCSEVVWRVLATHFSRQLSLHFPSRTLPFAITFQMDCTKAAKGAPISANRRRTRSNLCHCPFSRGLWYIRHSHWGRSDVTVIRTERKDYRSTGGCTLFSLWSDQRNLKGIQDWTRGLATIYHQPLPCLSPAGF